MTALVSRRSDAAHPNASARRSWRPFGRRERRARVIVGAHGRRAHLRAYSKEAQALGAAAVMVSPPRALKLNTESVVSHYKALASAVDIPSSCRYRRSRASHGSRTLARIAREVPSARTVKLEDPPTPFKTARILAAAGDVKVDILGGLGGVFLIEELMAGAAGVMTGFAYPEVLVKVVSLYRQGKIDDAANVFYRFVPLMRFEFQEGIGMAIRKEVLRRRGALADGSTRQPGPVLDEGTRAALDRVLNWTASQEGASWILA